MSGKWIVLIGAVVGLLLYWALELLGCPFWACLLGGVVSTGVVSMVVVRIASRVERNEE